MEHLYYSPEKTNSFFSKLIFILVFFTLTPIALAASSLSLVSIANSQNQNSQKTNFLDNPISGARVYASLPTNITSISFKIVEADARSEIIRNYLAINNSPLTPFADYIVKTADKYGIDWRLTTAIAMKESGLCKVIPEGSYNCWGWGIHSAGTLKFSSFEEGIETVTKGLKENYIDIGLDSVEKIMTKWIPHSPNGAWAEDVKIYLNKLI